MHVGKDLCDIDTMCVCAGVRACVSEKESNSKLDLLTIAKTTITIIIILFLNLKSYEKKKIHALVRVKKEFARRD